VATKVLDTEESAIEDADGGGGLPIVVVAGAAGVTTAVALGLLVFCLLRRRKQKLQLVTLEAAGSSNDPHKAQHAAIEATAVAAEDSEAPEADEVPRGGESPQALNTSKV
jgi:hypothetical protein